MHEFDIRLVADTEATEATTTINWLPTDFLTVTGLIFGGLGGKFTVTDDVNIVTVTNDV